ncbi:hypothetical protein ACFL08_00535 [Patescibacteria group bacterium]
MSIFEEKKSPQISLGIEQLEDIFEKLEGKDISSIDVIMGSILDCLDIDPRFLSEGEILLRKMAIEKETLIKQGKLTSEMNAQEIADLEQRVIEAKESAKEYEEMFSDSIEGTEKRMASIRKIIATFSPASLGDSVKE